MRLFVAIRFDGEALDRLEEQVLCLRAKSIRGRFTPHENLHLTLAFLGETDQLSHAVEALREVRTAPFVLRLGEKGRFIRPDGDICFVSAEESKALVQLQRQLSHSLGKRGFTLETQRFHPHVTMGRRILLREGEGWEGKMMEALTTRVLAVSLLSSQQVSGQRVYTRIEETKLSDKENGAIE